MYIFELMQGKKSEKCILFVRCLQAQSSKFQICFVHLYHEHNFATSLVQKVPVNLFNINVNYVMWSRINFSVVCAKMKCRRYVKITIQLT
jgi:hypothetical protein